MKLSPLRNLGVDIPIFLTPVVHYEASNYGHLYKGYLNDEMNTKCCKVKWNATHKSQMIDIQNIFIFHLGYDSETEEENCIEN